MDEQRGVWKRTGVSGKSRNCAVTTLLRSGLKLQGLSVLLLVGCCGPTAMAQQESIALLNDPSLPLTKNNRAFETPGPPKISTASEHLVSRFLIAEQKVRKELNAHTFKRDVLLQTIGPNGEVTGEYIRNSLFVFDDRGNRVERVLFRPRSTLRGMKITKEDIQDLAGAQLLGVDINEVDKYWLELIGKEDLGGRAAYIIGVRPKQEPDPHRMKDRAFVGRIWVDATSLHVIKVRGIVQPQGKQRFPIFETWREGPAGALPFPVRTIADDILHFTNKHDVHYRVSVRYYDYRRFASTVKITEVDQL